ncbi:MAG: hypothetical protein WCF31_10860, partial [Candidatus Deferrimicrobiaceae bacterium]
MLFTILPGAICARLVFSQFSIWEAGILAAILAPRVGASRRRTAPECSPRIGPPAYISCGPALPDNPVEFGRGNAARTATPVQTTAYFGMKRGFYGYPVDVGNPFPYWDFLSCAPLVEVRTVYN